MCSCRNPACQWVDHWPDPIALAAREERIRREYAWIREGAEQRARGYWIQLQCGVSILEIPNMEQYVTPAKRSGSAAH